ncbi:MAG: hypothetical protein FWD26_04330 [Treponema sp.]|nr:hypothetical protein [Treponema sp.]
MKTNKHNLSGIAVLLFGFLLAGCITIAPVAFEESEISREIFNVISQSIPSSIETTTPANPRIEPITRLVLDQRITAGEIIALLINRFPGMTELNISGGGINVSYQGKSYYISCDMESTGLVTTVGRNSIVLSIFSVKERKDS